MARSSLAAELAALNNIEDDNEDEGYFEDPFEETEEVKPTPRTRRKKETQLTEKSSKKEKKKLSAKKTVQDVIAQGEELMERMGKNFDMDFEDYVDNGIYDGEDSDLKDALIAQGRKYQRSHAVDENASEVEKAFAPQQKDLKDFANEITKDCQDISKDIQQIRGTGYGVNRKMLSELISAKSQLQRLKLDAIKEASSIQKTKFDILTKQEKNKANSSSGEDSSTAAISGIQSLMSMGHKAMIDSVGGRAAAAGSIQDDEDEYYEDINESDEVIQERYFKGRDEHLSEGDLYLKYENAGVQMVLMYDPDNPESKYIVAEDKDGKIIPEYPTPSLEDLEFEIDRSASDETSDGNAVDSLGRNYKLKIVQK